MNESIAEALLKIQFEQKIDEIAHTNRIINYSTIKLLTELGYLRLRNISFFIEKPIYNLICTCTKIQIQSVPDENTCIVANKEQEHFKILIDSAVK